jgi:hypothetical protein
MSKVVRSLAVGVVAAGLFLMAPGLSRAESQNYCYNHPNDNSHYCFCYHHPDRCNDGYRALYPDWNRPPDWHAHPDWYRHDHPDWYNHAG